MITIALLVLSFQVTDQVQTISTEEYFSLSYLSSCAISPSGKYTAWTEGRWDEELDKRNTDIWIIETNSPSGEPLRLTFDKASDGSIQWGADDSWLYFSSKRGSEGDELPRNGKKQVWRIKPDGTQLMAVTRLADGSGDWKLSQDGKSLYYLTSEETQIDDAWKTLRKKHDEVEYAFGLVDYSELWKLDLSTWKTVSIWNEDKVIQYFSPSPDETKIALITTPDTRLITNEGWSTLGIYDVVGKETILLNDTLWRAEAPSPYGWVESPKWASDGTRLAFSVDFDGFPRNMYVATFFEKEVTIQKVNRVNNGTLGTSPVWVPNSYDLLYIAEQKTTRPLLQIESVGNNKQGKTKEIIKNSLICWDFSISKNTNEIVALVGSQIMLTTVVKTSSDANFVEILANPNSHISNWKLPTIQTVQWKAIDGTTIEGVLELPNGYVLGEDPPLPMYVHLHGGPTSSVTVALEFSMYGRGLLSSDGWAILSPNYRGSTGYGDTFITDLVGRENDIEVEDILAGVDAMVERGVADPEKLAVGGWSNGGYLTNCLIVETDRFKAASSGAGVFEQTMQWSIEDTPGHVVNYAEGLPWEVPDELQRMSPLFEADTISTPTIIHVGAGDARVPAEQSKALFRALHDYLDVPTQLVIYPGTGHGLSKMSHRKAKIEWDNAWLTYWIENPERD
ncbi:MAG TPA: S9 family peptidase [Phycisphaerales bacterium]|nr:S9 family peptidase [Phycisphaerales bacterium]HIB00507.1 S9 family peptidase [Phycisphaerales bacterium]HIB51498.1 S9 family peptidase [Phycisphaerales bacterium]HIO19647.1 S9 family peptidase [Phycisphaerales bacterium]HIO52570.1 S9 family peptidase [Phycisphaerales bacterium]